MAALQAALATEVHPWVRQSPSPGAGQPVGVVVRTAAALAEVLAANPFSGAPANLVVAIFLDAAPAPDALDHAQSYFDRQLRRPDALQTLKPSGSLAAS